MITMRGRRASALPASTLSKAPGVTGRGVGVLTQPSLRDCPENENMRSILRGIHRLLIKVAVGIPKERSATFADFLLDLFNVRELELSQQVLAASVDGLT